MERKIYLIAIPFLLIAVYGLAQEKSGTNDSGKEAEMELNSSAFGNGEFIPVEYTCDGSDKSPNLAFMNVPENAASLALICEDPDAPAGLWVHWVVFNIPSDCKGFGTNIPDGQQPELKINDKPIKIHQGKNDFGKFGYGGPCPPKGPAHRYFFRLYALDTELRFDDDKSARGVTRGMILDAMENHIIAETELMGKYKRKE